MHDLQGITRAVLARPQDANGAPRPEILLTIFSDQPLPCLPLRVELAFNGALRAGTEAWIEAVDQREKHLGLVLITLHPARGAQYSIAAVIMRSGGGIETISALRIGMAGKPQQQLVRSSNLKSVEFVPAAFHARLGDLTPGLAAQALQAITGVTLHRQTRTVFYDPPLGTVGGAGNPTPAQQVTLKLSGMNAAQTRFLRCLTQQRPPAIAWFLEGRDGRTYRTLKWEMSRYGEGCLLLTIESPDGAATPPQRLSATIQDHDRSFQWPVDRATEKAS